MDIQVIDHTNLIRRRGAIVNKDIEGYLQFVNSRELKQKQEDRIKTLESQVSSLLEAFNKMGVK